MPLLFAVNAEGIDSEKEGRGIAKFNNPQVNSPRCEAGTRGK